MRTESWRRSPGRVTRRRWWLSLAPDAEQPLGRLWKAPAPADRFRDNPVGFADDGFILCQAREEFFGTELWVHPMARGHRPGVGFEPNGAEDLRAERDLSGVLRAKSPSRLPARDDARRSFDPGKNPHSVVAPP